MNAHLFPLLSLQGDIKIHLINQGLPQDCAHAAAASLLDVIARSKAIRPEVAQAYAVLSAEQEIDPDEPKPGDWLAVVDDSGCTVRLGGPGHLWKCRRQSFGSPHCWELEGVDSPYSKTIFRKATVAEIEAHLRVAA